MGAQVESPRRLPESRPQQRGSAPRESHRSPNRAVREHARSRQSGDPHLPLALGGALRSAGRRLSRTLFTISISAFSFGCSCMRAGK